MKSRVVPGGGTSQRFALSVAFLTAALAAVAAISLVAASQARAAPAHGARATDSSAHSQAVLVDSPWGYWKLAQGIGFPDSSGNNRPMTLTIGGWPCCLPWQPGPASGDSAPQLRGNPNGWTPGDRISRGIAASDFSDNFTAELWVFPLLGNYHQFLIGKGNPFRVNPYGWGLMLDGSTRLSLWVNAVEVITGPSIPLNLWTHVAVRRSGGTWTIYKNGVASGSSTAVPNAGGSDIYFGADAWGGGFNLKARVAHGALYATALSPDRIEAHYEAMEIDGTPSSVALPRVTGLPHSGETVTADPGQWSPAPTSYSYPDPAVAQE